MEDAADDYAWRCDPELSSFDAIPPLRMSYEDFLASYASELNHPSPGTVRCAIDDLAGKHICNIMYYGIDRVRREAELGILIGDRDYWGQGFGSDAIITLLRYIFETTDLQRIYLHTLDWNLRAQRCFEQCGFTPYRHVRRGGYDFIAMQLFRDSWLALQGGQPPAPQQEEPAQPLA